MNSGCVARFEKLEKFDKDIIKLLETIGFRFYKSSTNFASLTDAISFEYKYYPKYFIDWHYTLILFSSGAYYYQKGIPLEENKTTIIDHRLYIHQNLGGSYIDSPYQISSSSETNQKKIIEEIHKIFVLELRDQKLNQLIN